jgi:hypothetical protein
MRMSAEGLEERTPILKRTDQRVKWWNAFLQIGLEDCHSSL